MWFRFPNGCSSISVERQEFAIDITDAEGTGYFRAPDHFAPRILAIAGFARAEPPEGAPDDLPKMDPLRDGAIAELTKALEAQRIEIQGLSSDLVSAQAIIAAASNEKAELMATIANKDRELSILKDEIEDK